MPQSCHIGVILMSCACEVYTALKKLPCPLLDVVQLVDTPEHACSSLC